VGGEDLDRALRIGVQIEDAQPLAFDRAHRSPTPACARLSRSDRSSSASCDHPNGDHQQAANAAASGDVHDRPVQQLPGPLAAVLAEPANTTASYGSSHVVSRSEAPRRH